MTAEQLAKSVNHARSREAASEFRMASKAGKLFLDSIRAVIAGPIGRSLSGRIFSAMRKVVVLDPINDRGDRNVADGPIQKLREFEINPRAPLSNTLKIDPVPIINRQKGEMTLHFPTMAPRTALSIPQEATHFKLIAAGLDIDFKQFTKASDIQESELFSLAKKKIPAFQITTITKPKSNGVLFLLAGIRFYQVTLNGSEYILHNTAYNALKVVEVNKRK